MASAPSTLVDPVETGMDVVADTDPDALHSKSTILSSPSAQVRDDPPGKRVAKRSRVELDQDVEDEGVETKKGKKKGKKGKKKGVKKSKEPIIATENFTVDGKFTVILKVDDTMQAVDLRTTTVSALAAVDFDMVPFLKNVVSFP